MQQIINDVKCWRGFLKASIQSSECSASHCSHSFRNDWILTVTSGSERDLKLILSDHKSCVRIMSLAPFARVAESQVLSSRSLGSKAAADQFTLRLRLALTTVTLDANSISHHISGHFAMRIKWRWDLVVRKDDFLRWYFDFISLWQRNVVHFQECWWINHLFMKSWSGRLELWILDFCKGGKVERQRKSDMK